MLPVLWPSKLAVMATDLRVLWSGTNSSTEGSENTLKRGGSKNERRAAALQARNASLFKSNKRC